MDLTIIQQGRFIADGEDRILTIRSDIDWMRVYNYTKIGGATQFDGVEFYWQRGFAVNDGLVYFHPQADQTLSLSTALVGVNGGTVGGFTLIDSSLQTTGVRTALTAISTANPPRVTVASTALLKDGDVVRLDTITGAPQFGGIDFVIAVIDATHFDLVSAPTLAVAGTAGFYRRIDFDPIFYPRRRVITNITQAAQAVITTSVDHQYTVGQEVRLHVSAIFGMVEMNNVSATVVDITDDQTFVVDIDSTTFTAFAFPLAADVPFTPAHVVPLGEDTAVAIAGGFNEFDGATNNDAFIGMKLAGGAASPAGEDNDVVYWVAGKSFSNIFEPKP